MKILLMSLGLGLALSTGGMAHGAMVKVKYADKVVVKAGISEKKAMAMMHCLMNLKKYDSEDKAMDAAMEKVKDYCTKLGLNEKKCAYKAHKVAKHVHFCYTKAEFIRDYLGKTE